MPVKVTPSAEDAHPIFVNEVCVQNPVALLQQSCPKEYAKCTRPIKSSLNCIDQKMIPSSNGFVSSAVEAFNNHHHLQLYPEDIWFAILSQLSIYINRYGEEMRGKFVPPSERKELIVINRAQHIDEIDDETLATAMGNMLEENVVDAGLRSWLMPSFSTTTTQDSFVARVLIMGSLQQYIHSVEESHCNLPSVTLHGMKADWEKILERLDKLIEFGPQPTQFCTRLKPIITRFILSFDKPDSIEVKRFWNRIAHMADQGAEGVWYSGWISAFCFWTPTGRPELRDLGRWGSRPDPEHDSLQLDGVVYDSIRADDFPPGCACVPLTIRHQTQPVHAVLAAGSVALTCSKSTYGDRMYDTVAPARGWWLFEAESDRNAVEGRKPVAKKTHAAPSAREFIPASREGDPPADRNPVDNQV